MLFFSKSGRGEGDHIHQAAQLGAGLIQGDQTMNYTLQRQSFCLKKI